MGWFPLAASNLARVVDISTAVLTVIIAILAVYIAYQQWQTNKLKLVLERYDRRYRIYEEVKNLLGTIMRDANVSTQELLQFRRLVSEAEFLFGAEIQAYINQIFQRALKLNYWTAQYRDYKG